MLHLLFVGQTNHKISTKIQARSKGLKLSVIKPLVEDEAVKSGAEFFSEFLLVFVGLSTVAAELTRQYFAEKRNVVARLVQEQKEKEQKERRAVEKERLLRERLLKLEETLFDMENTKLEKLHDKIVEDQLLHLQLTEKIITKLNILENYLGINLDDLQHLALEDNQKVKESIVSALPKALPTEIRNIGQDFIRKEAAVISDPSFTEKAKIAYQEQENKILQATSQDLNQPSSKIDDKQEELQHSKKIQTQVDQIRDKLSSILLVPFNAVPLNINDIDTVEDDPSVSEAEKREHKYKTFEKYRAKYLEDLSDKFHPKYGGTKVTGQDNNGKPVPFSQQISNLKPLLTAPTASQGEAHARDDEAIPEPKFSPA